MRQQISRKASVLAEAVIAMNDRSDVFCSLPKVPASLSDDPVHFLMAEHDRHRKVCALLSRATRDETLTPAMLGDVSRFFGEELARHHALEMGVVFPLIRQRVSDDESLFAKLGRIGQIQRYALRCGELIQRQMTEGSGLNTSALQDRFKERIQTYTRNQFSALTYENAVILRIAEAVLRKGDLRRISDRIKEGYGLERHHGP